MKTMSGEMLILVLLVITALGFDFTNGFHDTGNAWQPRSPPVR